MAISPIVVTEPWYDRPPLLGMAMSVTSAVMGAISLGITLVEVLGGSVPDNAITSAKLSIFIDGIALVVSSIGVGYSINSLLNRGVHQ